MARLDLSDSERDVALIVRSHNARSLRMVDNEPRTFIKLVESEDLGLSEIAAEVLEGPVAGGVNSVFGLELTQITDHEKRFGLD